MSKKFTLITFAVQDGEKEYFDFYTFLTSDIQKMTKCSRHLIADVVKQRPELIVAY